MRRSIALDLRAGLILAALVIAPVATAPDAAAQERVKVRVGEHPGFDRLVFDWSKPVGVKLETTPERARLVFDRAGDLDLSLLRRDPPPGVRGVTPEKTERGLSVAVAIVPGSRVRLLESGSSTVLDILREDTPLDAAPAKRAGTAKRAPRVSKKTGPKPAPTAPAAPAVEISPVRVGAAPTPLTVPRPLAAKPEAVTARGAPRAEETAPPARGAPPLSLLDARRQTGGLAQERPLAAVPPAAKPPPLPPRVKPGKAGAKSGVARDNRGGGDSSPRAEPPAATQGGERSIAPVETAEEVRRGRLLVVADQGPSLLDNTAINFFDGVPQTMNNLRFQWDTETALAVYRRGSYLWLVFDRAVAGDVTEGLAELAPEMVPIDQFAAPNATLIRMTPPPILEPKITRDGATWVMELWPRPPRSPPSIEISIEGDKTMARIDFAIESPGRAVSFVDPESGAAMVVVPALIAEQGLGTAQTFPQFQALRSVQGLAIEMIDGGLKVDVAGPGVRVTHPDGLLVSKGATLALLKSNVRRPAVGPRLFDLPAWRRSKQGGFTKVRHALQAALAVSDLARRPIARLDLARFYFANGFASEAAGLLGVAETLDPAMRIDPEIRLMRGVSAFLAGDYGAASKDLFHPSLSGEAEADLWNGAMAAVGFDWDVASTKFAQNEHLIADYPHPVRARLWLLAAEAELAVNNLDAANAYLTKVLNDKPNRDEESQVAVLTGYSHLQRDEKEKARTLWRSVARFSEHPPSRTRARLALLDLAVSEQSVTAKEAIEVLERLRYSWRGDQIEIAVLQRLGDLYLTQGRYRDSLRAFRQATANVPSSRFARDVAKRMRDVFFDIVAGEEGENLPPLSVLALYEEFKELSPPSVKGDRMVARLADRLVEVDLLPRAADLLTAQVKYRLSGAEKAAVGARVASLQLLDEQPEKAITILGLSEEPNLPDDLARRRQYLRARALSELSRFEEALKLLNGDPNPEALRLRADILWSQANWDSAAVVLKQLVPEKPLADQPLTTEESRNVVDLAVALTLSGGKSQLAALGEAYRDAMAAGPDSETFALMTEGAASEADRSIAEKLAAVDKVDDFMTSYRDRLQEAQAN